MTICYLSSKNTLPGTLDRRSDAFEHDQMMDCLRPALAAHGLTFEAAAWDDPDKDWSRYDLVVIGTTWDYWDQLEKFLATLEQIALASPIFNHPALLRWNLHKQYLCELAEKISRQFQLIGLIR